MMMDARSGILLVLAFANSVFGSANIPVLIWNNHQSGDVNVQAVSALQQISVASLQARYFDAFRPNNVLLFLQDALNIEDLSSHGSELEHVNAWMQTGHSLYLPNVVQPAQLQHDLVQQGYKVTSLSAGTAIAELKLDSNEKNLVVVKLPPTITSPSRSRALRKADEVMQSVLSKIGGVTEFTVIYTAYKPSVLRSSDQLSSEGSERVRVARSLQQIGPIATPPSNFHNGSCVLIYFRKNMTISTSGSAGPYSPIPEKTFGDPLTECPMNSVNQSINLNYVNITLGSQSYYKLKIAFFFERQRSYWRSPRAEVIFIKESNSKQDIRSLQLVKWKEQSVPVGKSYACSVPMVFREPGNKTDSVELVVNGIQVEAFVRPGQKKFSASWDCVGFFTIGIWAGLFASFLAVIIISAGMAMLANIKTMDRFDDPKGKTIMVPQSMD